MRVVRAPERRAEDCLALPTRRRAIIWPVNPQPILRSLARSFANRIHKDIAGFFLQFVMVTEAVIEEIALPLHTVLSRDELLPVLHGRCHSEVTRKRDDRMQMIRTSTHSRQCQTHLSWLNFTAASTALPVSARHNWFLP